MNDSTRAHPRGLLDLALRHTQKMEWGKASEVLGRVLAVDPDNPDALNLMGVASQEVGLFEPAARLMERAIQARPSEPRFYINCGEAYRRMGKLDSAIARFRKALSLNPQLSMAHSSLGAAFLEQGRIEQALDSFRTAIRLDPENPDAHWNMSLALLMTGGFEEGWKEYDWRWEAGQKEAKRNYSQPRWDGRDLSGRSILLYTEQGFGDTLQCLRYLPLVAARGGNVIVECRRELKRLIQSSFPDVIVTLTGESLPHFDYQLPLMSLPGVFGTNLKNIPDQAPYLRAHCDLTQQWQVRTAISRNKFQIGLAWAGNRNHKNDRNRSLPPETLLPLLDVPGAMFFSLQKDEEPPKMSVVDLTGDLADFADTAALISNLDLIVTADTAVAHLAGALAKPVWTLIPFVPDWRWLLDRDDSPWYPTMRLFRQAKPGDWTSVIRSVAGELISHIRAAGRDEVIPCRRRSL